MLHALMDGRTLTASELARDAGIAPQTASGQLTRMTAAGLLSVEKQGRHRYHRLSSPGVARMMESIMQVASDLEPPRKRLTVGPCEAALRRARTCYDHLAGKLGVALTDALVVASYAELTNEAGLVTDAGLDFLVRMGVDLNASLAPRTKKSRRVLDTADGWHTSRYDHSQGTAGLSRTIRSKNRVAGTRLDVCGGSATQAHRWS